MAKFKLKSEFYPIEDQKRAVESLYKKYISGVKYQVLLGVTGSGKTFTIANLIDKLQIPTLIISHNKTLAGQLYQEFRDFFPENAVSYFVSYYDYYQPEAYIPSTDTYIEKDADINDLIDKLRLAATTNLSTRNDNIVVASVSSIYNLGSPKEYGSFTLNFQKSKIIDRQMLVERLVELLYERTDYGFKRGTFRIRGDKIDIYPAYLDQALRIQIVDERISELFFINPLTGQKIISLKEYTLYPAKHFITDPNKNKRAFDEINKDLEERVIFFKKRGKVIEMNRIKQRVSYDIQMIKEFGYVKGIENYSRYFDGRKPGEPPYTLIDYFNNFYGEKWLLVVDESHMTFPQIRGMYNGDLSRKKTLIDYGFRLPSVLDNRPLRFEEFMRKIPNFIATSATPDDWEINMANEYAKKIRLVSEDINPGVTEQLIRPTGIPDPLIEIKPTERQVEDVIEEIKKQTIKGQRTLVTTLTKKTAEDLSTYLSEKGLKVHYLHSEIETLERTNILDDLRSGKYDVLIGINLLREGLDLPEVSLVAILDADKEGFLRSRVSLIQTMGRAARHAEGRVILYADLVTKSIKEALNEVKRRRNYQLSYNKKYGITPRNIYKPIREKLIREEEQTELEKLFNSDSTNLVFLNDKYLESLTPMDKKKLINKLRKEMKVAASTLNFELAAKIRDSIYALVNS